MIGSERGRPDIRHACIWILEASEGMRNDTAPRRSPKALRRQAKSQVAGRKAKPLISCPRLRSTRCIRCSRCVRGKEGAALSRVQSNSRRTHLKLSDLLPVDLILRWAGCRPRMLEYFKDAASVRLDIVSPFAQDCILSTAGQSAPNSWN